MTNFKLKLWWHMIVRGHTEESLQAIRSLQGLYDGIVIAVDDREDSDEVFEALEHFPNMYSYRQKFSNFGRYDLARQDALDRVCEIDRRDLEPVNYVGWSDSDEILVSNPYEIRKWLIETQPESVNCGIHYLYPIGGHEAGQTYRNGRVRIWKHGTRRWSRPCHEYPTPINGVDNPVIGDIIFNHIKYDNSDYRADHHIELMQKEINSGNIGWLFYQAKEYLIKEDFNNAKLKYLEYLKSGEQSRFEETVFILGDLYLKDKDYSNLIKEFSDISIPPHPMICEYIAIAHYWNGNKQSAYNWHVKAKTLDQEKKYPKLNDNDQYFRLS